VPVPPYRPCAYCDSDVLPVRGLSHSGGSVAAGVKNSKIFFGYLLEPGMTMSQARHPSGRSGFIEHFYRAQKYKSDSIIEFSREGRAYWSDYLIFYFFVWILRVILLILLAKFTGAVIFF
jgi:hypothetical protein